MRYYILVILIVCLPTFVHAASPALFSNPYTDHTLVAVPLSVKTEGLSLNALSLLIRYDPTQLKFASAQENTLLGTRWVDIPAVDNGVVTVSLIVPGGFTNSFDPLTESEIPAELATLYFVKKDVISTPLTIEAQSAYYNTDIATLAHVTVFKKTVALDRLPVKFIAIDPTVGPRIVSVRNVVIEHSIVGSRYAVFVQAIDGAGIASMKRWDGRVWVDLANPASFTAHIFDQHIPIRIINGVGVYTESTINIPGAIPDKYRDFIVVLLGALCVGAVVVHTRKKTKKAVY